MYKFRKFVDKFRPELSDADKRAVESLKSMKTFRAVNGALYVEAEDVRKEMMDLHKKTRNLFAG
ncbi:hypothetical protein Xmar_16635 [Xanthomonas axonopodis pv. martyniicola]|nr:hypothetical protein Xmar_16635 [Xanthomonas axonopodis pv. martyniicola]OOW93533.1 hypothetical protein Xvtr_13685 [Xanthomonas campestris pv. vitiscarnosae]OOX25061.1 hypothetical protein Xazr_18495 [Xanthomonas campestris pv. azadirachtae]CEJ49777.1 hypothetical protein XAB3213_990007 [Xanthomonas citri pv. bilvae]